jgi:FkbM family methyltransferase
MAERLARDVRINKFFNVEVIATALGATQGRATFFHITRDSAYSSLQQRHLPPGLETGIETLEVPLAKLDDILSGRHQRVRFIKMDLEGGEYHAIRGGFCMIQHDRPFIIFENSRETTARHYGYDRHDWFELFSSLRFSVFDLLGRPFGIADWEADGVPWYFIAVSHRSSDERFVIRDLPKIIRQKADAEPTLSR